MRKLRRKTRRLGWQNSPELVHRVRILGVLIGICRNLERLQANAEAQRACRYVAGSLRLIVAKEKNNGGGNPEITMARILVIDDNQYMRQVLATCLPGMGHSVVLAENGEAGLKLVTEKTTDLILVDFDMPRMNGISLCEALKRDPMKRHIPVLMMTGRNKDEIMLRAKKAGAKTVLGKPFSWDLLVAEFDRHLPVAGNESPCS